MAKSGIKDQHCGQMATMIHWPPTKVTGCKGHQDQPSSKNCTRHGGRPQTSTRRCRLTLKCKDCLATRTGARKLPSPSGRSPGTQVSSMTSRTLVRHPRAIRTRQLSSDSAAGTRTLSAVLQRTRSPIIYETDLHPIQAAQLSHFELSMYMLQASLVRWTDAAGIVGNCIIDFLGPATSGPISACNLPHMLR